MRKNHSKIKGVVLYMGIMTLLSGLLGCANVVEPADEYTGIIDVSDVTGEYEKVTGVYFGVSGYSPGFEYSIYQENGVTLMDFETREDSYVAGTCEIDDETLDKISKLAKKLNIISWDKYDKSASGVLDGSGFSLTMDFADGRHIKASGSNRFPQNYGAFESTFLDIVDPVVTLEAIRQRDEKYAAGAYSEKLGLAMINYKGRGASGSDEYSFLIRDNSSTATKADLTVNSVSGEFIEPGNYRYYGDPEDTDELLAKIQEVLVKYDVYKWDSYNESTDDFNDREWFQLDFIYPEAQISCYGCGDTEHYAEVRQELLTILCEYVKGCPDTQ